MPVINGVYLKDFTALPGAVADANIIPIAISGDNIAYRTTVSGIVTDARVTSKLLTGLSITGSAILATDTILQAFGKVQNQLNNRVSSVGLSMPPAFSVANSPITSSGTIAVTGAGLASQYIRGDGQLADFPTSGGGGGSSVSYYLNGSVNQGTFGGNTYYEMNKVPVFGAGTDFSISSNGYIAQFITDANDPNALLIPAGNWNFETYFSASSGGGTPTFYVELYKYNGTTFTLIASNSGSPELISFGTTIAPYFSALAVPETILLATDRLAIRVYVTHSGRTITLHTENSHLCQVITTFTTGIQALNGLTKQTQYFAVGTSGTDFNISSTTDTHTFNLPNADSSNRGVVSTGTQSFAGVKTFLNNIKASDQFYIREQNALNLLANHTQVQANNTYFAFTNGAGTGSATFTYNGSHNYTLPGATGTIALVGGAGVGTVTSVAALTLGTSGTDLSSTVANGTTTPVITLNVPTASATNRGALSSTDWSTFNSKQGAITLTTTGTSGAATLIGNTLNIPQYSGGTITLAAIGSTPNANGATLTGTVLNLEPASASFGGVVTTGTQTIGGFKTFNSTLTISNGTSNALSLEIGTSGNTASLKAPATGSSVIITLPAASGTIALTSDLSGYLPLSGGTLTGALTGTTATFANTTALGVAAQTTAGFYNGVAASASGSSFFTKTGSLSSSFSSGFAVDGTYLGGLSTINLRAIGTRTVGGYASSMTFILDNDGVDRNHAIFSSDGSTTLYGALSGTSATFSGTGTFGTLNSATIPLVAYASTSNIGLKLIGTSTGNGNGTYYYANNGSTLLGSVNIAGTAMAISNEQTGILYFSTSGSERVRIASNGNVGIGTSSPSGILTVRTGTNENISILSVGGGDMRISALNDAASSSVQLSIQGSPLLFRVAGGVEAMRLASTGAATFSNNIQLGGTSGTLRIGTNAGDFATFNYSGGGTSVRNDWASTSAFLDLLANSVGFRVLGTGNATLTGTLTQGVSDERFKKNIELIPNALEKIKSINGYTFEYDLENEDLTYIPKLGRDIGVLAQEIEKVIPEAVSIAPIDRNEDDESKSGKNYLTVNYEKIIPLLIQSIKELKAEIDLLKGVDTNTTQ